MRITGVICEYNPFHNGHKYLLEQLRERGADMIICAMSGSFVQRGETAIADKFTRAACAVAAGADLAVELPFPYCGSGAEFFASAGVYILDKLGVDTLGFGSESADLEGLTEAVAVLETEQFAEQYRALCRAGQGNAAAYFRAYEKIAGRPLECGSNDILALAYIKEIRRLGGRMQAEAVRRLGSDYNSDTVTEGQLASATALRELVCGNDLDAWRGHIPDDCFEHIRAADSQGLFGSRIENIGHNIITHLRLCDVNSFADTAETAGGLAERIWSAAGCATDYEGLIRSSMTGNYTAARVRRGLLNMLLGVTENDIRSRPAYVQLLAAGGRGREYLAARRREDGLPIVTKPADAREIVGGERQYKLNSRAEALWCMTLPTPLPADTLTKMKPVFM